MSPWVTPSLHQRLEQRAAALGDRPMTLGDLADAHGTALPGSLLVAVSAPCALPIPGIGNVLGVTMMLMALAMWRGREWTVLPVRVSRFQLSARAACRVLRLSATLHRLAARWSRPRLGHLAVLPARTWVAPTLALMGVVIFLPLPFGNVLPALAVTLLGIGMAFGDGLAMLSAAGLAIASLAYVAAVAAGVWTWVLVPLATGS